MKKILFVVVLGAVGYWYYQQERTLPLQGTWAPNQAEFMRKAYAERRMTPAQASQAKAYLAATRVNFDQREVEFNFPDRQGRWPYKVSSSGNDCYGLEITRMGSFDACVAGSTMTLRNLGTGVIETYDKVTESDSKPVR